MHLNADLTPICFFTTLQIFKHILYLSSCMINQRQICDLNISYNRRLLIVIMNSYILIEKSMLSLSLYKTCAISFLFGNLTVKVKAAPLMSVLIKNMATWQSFSVRQAEVTALKCHWQSLHIYICVNWKKRHTHAPSGLNRLEVLWEC